MNTRLPATRAMAIVLAAVLAGGCATLVAQFDYRDVQRDFNNAVQADNVRTVEALGALTSTNAGQLYDDVRLRLSDQRIRTLDERVQPNAYAVRAVSEWRTGRLAEARSTALTGLRLPNAGASPRDEMVLQMIPALVIDEELVAAYRQAGGKLSRRTYEERYAADFATAAAAIGRATEAVRPSTPDSVLYYVYLQRWRILQNWRIVISGIEDGPDARQAALEDANRRLGADLRGQIQELQQRVPADEPIRKAMEALALRP
jgi:hypothetical protein